MYFTLVHDLKTELLTSEREKNTVIFELDWRQWLELLRSDANLLRGNYHFLGENSDHGAGTWGGIDQVCVVICGIRRS